MTQRTRDRRGNLLVVRGRHVSHPFGRIPDWPERQQGLDAMQAAESQANERRVAYRQAERRQPCSGCGALPAFPHNLGCATPWG